MGSLKRSLANNILTSGKFDATDLTGNLPSSNIANASMTSITAFPASAGSAIALVASDPPAPTVGDVWYNTTSNALKYAGAGVGTWATGGNLGTARQTIKGAGTQTAGLAFSGYTGTLPFSGSTEEYDGTTWTAGGTMGSLRVNLAGLGTQTAGLAAAGETTTVQNATEEYDGSAWTAGGNVATARQQLAGCGIQTAALAFGGDNPTPGFLNVTEEYNGASWTTVSSMATGRYILGGAGTQAEALAFGGNSGSITNATEEWTVSAFTAKTITTA